METATKWEYERFDGGMVLRFDMDGKYPGQRFWGISTTDRSPHYPHWESGKYNSKCSACWLGHGHTTAMHERNIAHA